MLGESGWDNSKRYILGKHLRQNESPIVKQKRFIQSPDFNTYIYISREIILRIAREIGKEKDFKGFHSKMEKTKSGIQSMWNNDNGLYMDRFENDYSSYWNGRVWPQINWLIIEGLYRSKEYSTASDLSKLFIRMCYATGEPWCMETYNPVTGYPYLSHNCFNYIWGGMFLDILIRRVTGLQGNAPKNEVYINPLLNEDITQLSIKDIKIGDHILDFSLKRQGKEIDLAFIHRGSVPIILITSAGREKVYNTELKRKITSFDTPHFLEL